MNKKVFGLLLSTYLLKGDSLINWQFAKELDPCLDKSLIPVKYETCRFSSPVLVFRLYRLYSPFYLY